MNETVIARHIKDVAAVVNGSVITNPHDPESVVHKSWLRCTNDYGLDPARRQPAQIVDDRCLREHREQIEEFMVAARGGMEQLYKRMLPLGYVLLLTDAEGIAVDYIGELDNKPLKESGLYLGANWNEVTTGTCAVGTCLIERVPLTIHQDDHFDSQHIGLTCTAAPLYDPNGTFLGVLDVSALQSPSHRDSQHLAFHMTTMYAQMIEDANFLRHFRNNWIMRLGTTWALIEVSGEAMIAFDDDGRIVGANTAARKVLQIDQPGFCAVGQPLTDLFDCHEADIWKIARSGGIAAQSLVLKRGALHFFANVIPPRYHAGKPMYMPGERRNQVRAAQSGDQGIPSALQNIAGNDRGMKRLIEQATMLVDRKLNILIHGETGSGKEVFAKAIHQSSQRRDKPFIAVNCGAIPDSLIESELFGYTGGSFTGGRSKGMKGLILQSDGGTLFLDEIGDMPIHLQTRLLRVLSEKEVLPLGADRPIPLNLNVIAASHRDLRTLIARGDFREDLYYRLCGATLHLPTLRAREDLPFLIYKILEEETADLGEAISLSEEALVLMKDYNWPGNVRELRNVLRYAAAICTNSSILADHLPPEIQSRTKDSQPALTVASEESNSNEPCNASENTRRDQLLVVLRRHKWNVTTAASELGTCRATVYRWMKRYMITPPNQLF